MKRRALFLDRDGVINVDHGYVFRPQDFDFIDGIFDLVALAKQRGYLVVVVTNQAGIGRGYYSQADFLDLMEHVRGEFRRKHGDVDAVYFCPDHPDGALSEFAPGVPFRKPGAGMILQAAADLDIDLSASILVGDKTSDVAAGAAAGVGTNLLYCEDPAIAFEPKITRLADAGAHLMQLSAATPQAT